jgi:hypothetical protein
LLKSHETSTLFLPPWIEHFLYVAKEPKQNTNMKVKAHLFSEKMVMFAVTNHHFGKCYIKIDKRGEKLVQNNGCQKVQQGFWYASYLPKGYELTTNQASRSTVSAQSQMF